METVRSIKLSLLKAGDSIYYESDGKVPFAEAKTLRAKWVTNKLSVMDSTEIL